MIESVPLVIALGQLNFMVGDIDANTQKVISAAQQAFEQGADVIVFPELALLGYPPEDLLLRPSVALRIERALQTLARELPKNLYTVVGFPRAAESENGNTPTIYNSAAVFFEGAQLAVYDKQELPNYQVFDEKRYFTSGTQPCIFSLKGIPTALTICEDIWHPGPMAQAKQAGAQLMLNLNASPYHWQKAPLRESMLRERIQESAMPIVYANLVGGQDELVFDGSSMIMDGVGALLHREPEFAEGVCLIPTLFVEGDLRLQPEHSPSVAALKSTDASVYEALVLGVKDYVNKNGFKGAVLGLSGGIDSAVTLAVAADALGADRVEAVMMPFRYTAQMSLDDAEAEASRLGVRYSVLPIESMYDAFMATLADEFAGLPKDTTEENLQARCRGVLLMAISNKKGYIVLTTGNKSEMAVGYSTLYGDMAGGFDVLKDVPKTQVYRLANYRNQLTPDNPPIPQNVIDRPPSAELAPDQKDQDSLPDYDILDQILALYVEQDYSAQAIIDEGFAEDVVKRVIRLVDLNEYKRRQAPVGVRITPRGFGRDRRYPITCRWPAGD